MQFTDLYAKTAKVPKTDAALYLKKYSCLLRWKKYKERILDVGCGDGYVTKTVLYPRVQDHLEKLEAVDLLEEMIEYAKTTNSASKINYRKLDAGKDEDFANLSIKFDHIFSFYCVHWIQDQKALFKRFYDALNPGGQIFITTLSDTPIHRTFKKHLEKGTWSKYLPNTNGFTDYTDHAEEYVRELIEQSGLTVELCKAEKKAMVSENFEGFIRSLINMHPFINYIPEELREKYIQDHIQSTCELYDKETYNCTYESLVLVATKKM